MACELESVDFRGDNLVMLEDENFDRLLAGHTLELASHASSASNKKLRLEPLLLAYPRRAMVQPCRYDRSNACECESQFERFLRTARFAREVTGSVEPRQIRATQPPTLHDWLENELMTGRRGARYAQLNHNLDGGIHDSLYSDVAPLLLDQREVKGPISECGCGEPGCSSEYAWFADGVCLCLLRIVAAGMRTVELFPFDVLKDFQDPRWLALCREAPPNMRGDFDRYLWFCVNPDSFETLRHTGILEVDRESHEQKISELALVTRDDVNASPASKEFSLERLLAHSVLARVNYSEELRTGEPKAILALESPFSAFELLTRAAAKPPVSIARMNYAPERCTPGLDCIKWNVDGRVLAETVYGNNRIERIRLLPWRPYGSSSPE
jgi:hypothetical protein